MKRSILLSVGSFALIALLIGGCLVSATFVVDYELDFSAVSNFHHSAVDLTQEDIWQEHSDKLDDVVLVGFELKMNNTGAPATVSLYIDDINDAEITDPANLDNQATIILSDFEVPSGESSLTYGESISLLMNVSTLVSLTESGAFRFYAYTKGGSSVAYGKAIVIVTFTASET